MKPPKSLPHVIALVGSDGSGKSTLAADLVAALAQERPTLFLYLGQSSGNIARAIVRIPLIGPVIEQALKRRSAKAHDEAKKTSAPTRLEALVFHLLSRWRFHKFRQMIVLDRAGTVIVTDRYPQAEVPGFYFDGSGLAPTPETKGFVRWIARREVRLYQRMAASVPALIIRLNVSAATAHARKPDHRLSMLEDKVRVIPALTFNGARIVDLDANRDYPAMLKAAIAAAREALSPAS